MTNLVKSNCLLFIVIYKYIPMFDQYHKLLFYALHATIPLGETGKIVTQWRMNRLTDTLCGDHALFEILRESTKNFMVCHNLMRSLY